MNYLNFLNSLYMEEKYKYDDIATYSMKEKYQYIDTINNIAYTTILCLNSHISTDNIRHIWEFLKDDYKKQININYIKSFVNRQIERKRKNKLNTNKYGGMYGYINYALTYHIYDVPFSNIYPDDKLNGLLEYLKMILIKYHFRYSHKCCNGNAFVFIKNLHSIRKPEVFPVSDISGNTIGTFRIGN